MGVDNATIESTGRKFRSWTERSAFVAAIDQAASVTNPPRAVSSSLEPVPGRDRRQLRRAAPPMRTASAPEVEIDFANPVIGARTIRSTSARKLRREISRPDFWLQ